MTRTKPSKKGPVLENSQDYTRVALGDRFVLTQSEDEDTCFIEATATGITTPIKPPAVYRDLIDSVRNGVSEKVLAQKVEEATVYAESRGMRFNALPGYNFS